MRKPLAFALLATFASTPALAQERASGSTLAGVSFSELAWAWDSDENGSKKQTVEAAASKFDRSCGDTEFFAFQTSSPDALAQATMGNFRDAGWKIDDFSATEGPLHYRASLGGAELAVAWKGVDSGVALFLCNAIPVTAAAAEEPAATTAQDTAPPEAKPAPAAAQEPAPQAADEEDDLDFSDSPHLFATIFGTIGSLILGFGIYNRRRAAASTSWPQAPGTILSSTLGHEKGKDVDGDAYENWWPAIRYNYSVDGRPYEADRLRFGSLKVSDEDKAKAMIAPYPQGASVMVRYNPEKPEDATLESAKPGLGTPIFIGGFFLFFACVALAAANV
jgi:hypothetical protein